MSARYIVTQEYPDHSVPRCDLPGSPFPSRLAAKKAAERAGIIHFDTAAVRRPARKAA